MDKRILVVMITPAVFTPEYLFRALSDDTRLRCLSLLASENELCVCELTFALNLTQPKISRHLAYLRDLGLVEDRRARLWVYYRLASLLPSWANTALLGALNAINKLDQYATDRAALAAMPNRPSGRCCV